MTASHEILGVDADADRAAIERAYKRRVKEAHPDHGGSVAEFKRVRSAYESLTDASRPGDDAASVGDPGARTGGTPATDGTQGSGVSPGPGARPGPRQRTGSGESAPEPDDRKTRVEYLNYEVLDDRAWGLGDVDLFEKASDADLDVADYGRFVAEPGETLLEAAEERGFAWPFACRGGACANCAVLVLEGDLTMPANHVLPEEMLSRGIQLSCVGTPTTDRLRVVYNVKHLPDLEDLRLPPTPFRRAYSDD